MPLVIEGMGGRYANIGRLNGDTVWAFEGQEIFKRAVLGMSGACADVLESRPLDHAIGLESSERLQVGHELRSGFDGAGYQELVER